MPKISSKTFKVKDLVWGKVPGHHFWPGIVVEKPKYMPAESSKQKAKARSYCVLFFGTRQYSWCNNLVDYKSYDKKNISKPPNGLIQACDEIEKYISTKDPSLLKPKVDLNIEPSLRILKASRDNANKTDRQSQNRRLQPQQSNPGPSDEDGEGGLLHQYLLADLTKSNLARTYPTPLTLTIGFIGLGNMGSGIVKNLLKAKYKVVIWNRTVEKTEPFIEEGAVLAETPCKLAESVDVIFSCLSGEHSVVDVCLDQEYGVLKGFKDNLIYVEMTTINESLSSRLQKEITTRNGRFMTCFMQGGITDAELGRLTLLCGGNEQVYDELKPVLDAITSFHKHFPTFSSAYLIHCSLMTLTATNFVEVSEGLIQGMDDGASIDNTLEFLLAASDSFIAEDKINHFLSGDGPTNHVFKRYYEGIMRFLSLSKNDPNAPLLVTRALSEKYKYAMNFVDINGDITELMKSMRY